MAEQILVSPAEMQSTIERYTASKQQQSAAYLQMSNAVRVLDGTWQGPASETFKASFQAMYKNLEQTEAKMQDAIDELTQAAELFRSVEEAHDGAFGALEAGTNPFA
jgi:WXG100 family type VII secretion target